MSHPEQAQTLALSSKALSDHDAAVLLRRELTALDLSRNMITLKALRLASSCPNLRELNLSFNKTLRELPTSIGHLVHLQRLHLQDCRLQRLPVELGGLESLKMLETEGNPLVWPPPHVSGHGGEWTLDFLRCEFHLHREKLKQQAEHQVQARRAWDASLATVEAARAELARAELIRESLCEQLAKALEPAIVVESLPETIPDVPFVEPDAIVLERVQMITRSELNEIRTLLRPPAPARRCLEALWVTLEKKTVQPKWDQVQRMLASSDFKRQIVDHTDGIDEHLQRFIIEQLFEECGDFHQPAQKIARASRVCGVLWEWVRAQAQHRVGVPKDHSKPELMDVRTDIQDKGILQAEASTVVDRVEGLRFELELAQDASLSWEAKFKAATSAHEDLIEQLGLEFVSKQNWRGA